MKKCKICNLDKSENEFYSKKSQNNGQYYYSSYCKSCERHRSKEIKKTRYHDPSTRPEILARIKERTSNPEYRDDMNAKFREKYDSDPEFKQKIINKMRENRSDPVKNKVIRDRAHAYYQQNKHEIYKRSQEKDEKDPRRKLRGFMRGRISEALKAHGKTKDGVPSLSFLGYSWDDLYAHLESNFEGWMNWDNYGGCDDKSWNIDHIIPQSFFPYDSMDCDLFKWCWSLDNLRPYNSIQNFKDGDRSGLLGPIRDMREIFNEVVNHKDNPIIKELPSDIMRICKNMPDIGDVCPMSMVGLSYLDSIFGVRYSTSTADFVSLNNAVNDKHLLIRHLILKESIITPALILGNLKYVVRTPGHFFPMAAASVYKKYGGKRIFDPFLGWGGRTLGAICSNVDEFVGCDLQKEVVDGCKKVSDDFLGLSCTKTEFYNVDSLEYLKSQSRGFDLIFTSPPFMDTEKYGVESDSMKQGWLDSFVFPFVHECARNLNQGGCLALHLKDIKGAPTFTAYHAATKAAGLKQVGKHKYGRTWTQAIYVYSL
jgi:16S rRNA G966 N2-methylase RsmD/predicted Fe-S protein YdhL (DUF1289 family)